MASENALLTEYRIAQDVVSRLNREFWQSAQIFIPLSVAGVAYFGGRTVHTYQTLTTIFMIGLGSSLILWAWYRLVTRLWSYQFTAHHRRREIEAELDLWLARYGYYIAMKSRGQDLLRDKASISDEERKRYERLSSQVFAIPSGIPFLPLVRFIVSVMIIGWMLLIVREAALVLGLL